MIAGHTLDQWIAGAWGALFLGAEVWYYLRNRIRRTPRH
jgi:hypothetical protein